jgi:hypothetical protein
MVRFFRDPKRSRLAGAVAVAAVAGFAVFVTVALAESAVAPSNRTMPTISGKAQEGQTLKAEPGAWIGTQPIEYSYQWRRCTSPASASCGNIPNAIDQIYTPSSADVGRMLRVLVTAVNSEGAGTALSNPTPTVVRAGPQSPRNTVTPTISGNAQQDQSLTANPGSWAGTQPIQIAFRWRRCDANGGACVNTGVTTSTYKLGAADVGATIRVVVTATNSIGSSAAVSGPTAAVQGTTPPPGQCLTIAQVSVPERLVIDRIQYQPARIQSTEEPLTARFHVVSTRGFCVSGALVYAVGVPFNRLSAQPEVQTGPDGWAQVTFTVLPTFQPTFQLRRGNFVVIFVRARKGGENILAGVSNRRLVSVRVG